MLTTSTSRNIVYVLLFIGGFITLFSMYYKTSPTLPCHRLPTYPLANKPFKKPIMLLWFWPENYRFDFEDCRKFFNIDGCHLTDDRTLYSEADAILIYHRSIKHNGTNLPPSPRPCFQKWIWFHMESPTNTQKVLGIENLFNETLNYHRDADIPVRWRLTKKTKDNDFVLPRKERMVCWIVSNNDSRTGTDVRDNYYRELVKHIKVDVFGKVFGTFLKNEDYFSTIASCKFYLSFENSIHKDYITEKLNGPLAAGTVPVVLGPPRQNYENFIPGDSFIHVNDFPDAKALADFLLQLDRNDEAYLRYFSWRQYFSARPHLIEQNQEFIQAICYGCAHVAEHREYRVVHNLYKWYFG
ncbi:4-galactosyl-N-acetylglucosaminide 3-alpha-L-fucosyltransferase 9-like [Hypomesus transpacificus]|uniref:4-galactosyl-N-acetylglucosaminide 3-alpha-L-fucosyltransferase 9-like n=1 Tax=Hypomesus transpacificus TaxID=137520 RepID=UPI001F080EBD|nr:4-galactosyl-N-acetylglucosaminide 3-alpha-L-fucosyltransferase 9-like [Hypomesus transpacificus]